MGTWGFFIGFAAVSLYGPAAKYFQEQMHLSGLALGLLVAAPQLTGSLMRIPFGAWVDRVGGRMPMLTLFALSLVGMWGLVFILLTAKTLTVAAYPIIVMFGFLSGCGVASFSVGIPQVSYWYPQSRQGTVLGAYGGIGNLAPGIFTLLLPYAIATWGLAGSYFAWFGFLLVGTAHLCLAGARRLFLPASPAGRRRRKRRAASPREKGQELFPNERVWQAVITAAEDPRTWGLVALYFVSFGGFLALTAWFPTYWINLHHMDVKSAAMLGGLGFSLLAADHPRVRRHAVGAHRRRAHRDPRFRRRAGRGAHPDFHGGFLSGACRRIADRARHGRRQCRGVQDGAEIRAGSGRRRGRPGRRAGRARRLRHSAVPRRRRRCARHATAMPAASSPMSCWR